MQTFKNVLYYVWWVFFWFALLGATLFFEVEGKQVARYFAPFIFLGIVAYGFYSMLKTKPALPTQEQSPTSDTKPDAGTQDSSK